MTPPKKANPYLESMVMTASPEQLQLMLFDGALRFIDAALAEGDTGSREAYAENVSRARRIVAELVSSLKPSVAPELCSTLAGLYVFVYQKLVAAGIERNTDDLNDARTILQIQRDTWAELCGKLQAEKSAGGSIAAAEETSGNEDGVNARLSIAV